jgi:hypothetical protein
MIKKLQKIMKKLEKNASYVFNFLILSTIYIFIVGATSFLAKLFGKSFLFESSKNKKHSTFIKFQQSEDLRKMY